MGRRLFALDAADGTERWRYRTRHDVTTRPTVVGDTVVYVRGAWGIGFTDDVGVTALSLDGDERWRMETPPATILETSDSTAFVGVHQWKYGTDSYPASAITAVDVATGRERWHDQFGKFRVVSERDGTLYVGTSGAGRSNPSVTAVNAHTGTSEWEGDAVSVGAVTDRGLFGFRRSAGEVELVRLGFDGQERWSRAVDATERFLVGGGTVYVGADGWLAAHDAGDGTRRWRIEEGVDWETDAHLGGDTLYLARNGALTAVADDGTHRWKRRVTERGIADVTAVGGSTLVVHTGVGLVGLGGKTGDHRWSVDSEGDVIDTVVADDRLYATTETGTVYGLSVE